MTKLPRTTLHLHAPARVFALAALCVAASACLGPVDDGTMVEEQSGAALDDGPMCRDEIVDVNHCGEPWKECVYLRYLLVWEDRECCAPGRRQHVDKMFWDCSGDGRPDCEFDQWHSYDDPSCGAPTAVEEETAS